MKLAVAVEGAAELDWLSAFDFGEAGIEPVFYHLEGEATLSESRAISHSIGRESAAMTLPDFGEIVRGFEADRPEAVLVFSPSGLLGRLVTVAADMLGFPVFSLVSSAEELANAPRRPKSRPDLFFVADDRLLPEALGDPRYGATLLPTGHPGRDRAIELGGGGDFGERRFGDGKAAGRILDAIRRWSAGTLDPALPDLAIIVPAYKEAKNLPMVCGRLLAMLEGAPDLSAEILLVDDASPDDTYAVAIEQMWRSPRIRAFTKPTPRGMGNGIRYGLSRSRAGIVCVTMGDGSDEVERIPEMFRKVKQEGYSLAIGCRYRRKENYEAVPWLYRFWSRFFRLTTLVSLGFDLADYTNAFRVYDKAIFSRYGAESGGFEISPETTFKAWYATRRVTEVDVKHLKRASGQSSFSFLRAGPGYGKILTKAFVQRFTGRWFTLDW
jgi:hypothetical protein